MPREPRAPPTEGGRSAALLRARGADVLAFDTPRWRAAYRTLAVTLALALALTLTLTLTLTRWSDAYGGPIKTSSAGGGTSAEGEPLMGAR